MTAAPPPAPGTVSPRSTLPLAVALLAGIYLMVLGLGLLGVCLFVPVILALGRHIDFFLASVCQFVAVGSVPGVMLIYYGVFAPRRPAVEQVAVVVSPGEALGLWDLVTEVAATVGTRPPTLLRVTGVANASVTEEILLLGFGAGERCLNVGMPLLLGVSTDELRAIIAHEMGHYARGHTLLGAQVYRGSIALRNTCYGLSVVTSESGSFQRRSVRLAMRFRSLYPYIAYRAFSAYSAFYDRVSFAARRRQELQADACAAENYGRDVMASALRAAHALPVAWKRFRDRYLEPMRKAGDVPDKPFSAFEAMLSDPGYRDEFDGLRQSPPERPAASSDSHPTLAQRLAALGAGPHDAAPEGAASAPAITLLTEAQRQSISGSLRRRMFPVAAWPGTPWQEWAGRAAAGAEPLGQTPAHASAQPAPAPAASVSIRSPADPVALRRHKKIRGITWVVVVVTSVIVLADFHLDKFGQDTYPNPPFGVRPYTPPASFPTGLPSGLLTSLPSGFPTAVASNVPGMISIVVRPGDSLSLLACRYETTVSLLQAVNSLGTSTHIVVGQHLFVLAPLGLTRAC